MAAHSRWRSSRPSLAPCRRRAGWRQETHQILAELPMRTSIISSLLLLLGESAAFALAPSSHARRPARAVAQPRMALELLHDHTTLSELTQQLAGVIPGLPGYADDPNYVSGGDWNGGAPSLQTARMRQCSLCNNPAHCCSCSADASCSQAPSVCSVALARLTWPVARVRRPCDARLPHGRLPDRHHHLLHRRLQGPRLSCRAHERLAAVDRGCGLSGKAGRLLEGRVTVPQPPVLSLDPCHCRCGVDEFLCPPTIPSSISAMGSDFLICGAAHAG